MLLMRNLNAINVQSCTYLSCAAVKLLVWENLFIFDLFKVQLYLCVYLFLDLSIYSFYLPYYFSA